MSTTSSRCARPTPWVAMAHSLPHAAAHDQHAVKAASVAEPTALSIASQCAGLPMATPATIAAFIAGSDALDKEMVRFTESSARLARATEVNAWVARREP